MQPVRVVQQYAAGEIGGGLKTEYEALMQSDLAKRYRFIPVELHGCHAGISPSDILFYYHAFRAADADIIHIRGAGVESLNAVLAAKLARRGKILVTVHGMFSDLVYYSPVKRWISRNVIERMIFSLADGISCVCEAASRRKRFVRYRRKMLPFVYNRMPDQGILSDAERSASRTEFGISSDEIVFAYVGRVTKEKGLSFLLEALQALDEDWPEGLVFLIVGAGPYLAEMRSACEKLRHAAVVRFTGQLEHVESVLSAADCFISPSLHENLSISILEACAAHLPCLVTDVGGNSEIVQHNRNGLLIAPRSSRAICEGVRMMCETHTRAHLRTQAAEMDYAAFSPARVDTQLDSVYRALLSEKERNV